MADTKISALAALTGANSAPGDLLDIVDVSDTSMAATGTNKKITREELQTFGLGTITTDKKVLDLSVTWNNAGVTFTGLKFSVTDTASNAASLLMDLQVGGVSKFSVDKTGKVIAAVGASPTNPTLTVAGGGGNSGFASSNGYDYFYTRAGSPMLYFGYERIDLGNSSKVTWSSALGGTADVVLNRDAAATLALRNSTNAQTFNIYNTYTDASNYERLGISWSGNVISIKPVAAGTGTVRELHISGLPTANPGPGILWNNAGTPAIGT